MTETLDLVIIILATGLGIGLGWLLGKLKFSTELVRVEAEAQAAHGNKATLVAEMESVATAVARQNSEDFLRLAEERLGKVQSEANKDYDARKKEVELLVSPIKDHLEKLEKATTDMEKIGKEHTKASSVWSKVFKNKPPTCATPTSNFQQPCEDPSRHGGIGAK